MEWPGKVKTTFSDAITAVRRWLWVNWVFANHGYGAAFSKLSRPVPGEDLLSALAPRLRNGGKRAEDELRTMFNDVWAALLMSRCPSSTGAQHGA